MIELCRTEGQKLLFEGQYDRVVPAALESLKFSIEVYGLSSIELVPSYLILGEASIGWYFVVYVSNASLPVEWIIYGVYYRQINFENSTEKNFELQV